MSETFLKSAPNILVNKINILVVTASKMCGHNLDVRNPIPAKAHGHFMRQSVQTDTGFHMSNFWVR